MSIKKLLIIPITFGLLSIFTGCGEKKEEKVEIKKEIKKVDVDVYTLKKQTYDIWVDRKSVV